MMVKSSFKRRLLRFLYPETVMVRIEPTFEDTLDFLKELLRQPLSEETKDDLLRRIDGLSSTVLSLREENRKLRAKLHLSTKGVRCSACISMVSAPSSPYGGGGMVDLLRLPYQKPEADQLGSPPRTGGPRRPEPLRARNTREPPKDVKFAKYPPLPAIKSRPKLLRERTYDVIEPLYVKGPIKTDEKPKLPEIRKSSSGRIDTGTAVRRKTAPASPRPPPPAPVSRHLAPPTTAPRPAPLLIAKSKPEKKENKKTREVFNPSALAPPSDIPTNVFWFPM